MTHLAMWMIQAAQQATQAVQPVVQPQGAHPIVATHTMDQLAVNAICVWILQQVKKAKFIPFIQQNTYTINRIAALLLAGVTTAGIGFTFDRGDGTLVITGLTLAGIVTALWHWVTNYALQETIYQAAVNKQGIPNPPPVQP